LLPKIIKNKRIVFNGNNYSQQEKEAAKRLRTKTLVDALS
jgi:glutamine synthetase type III